MSKELALTAELSPDEIRRQRNARRALETVPSKARTVLLIIVVMGLIAFPLPAFLGNNINYPLHMALLMLMYVAMATSWNILGGYAGYVSLGHNVFFAIGGYLSGMILVYTGIPSFVTAPLGGLLAMFIGFGVGLITLRVRGPAFIISTIALLLAVRIIFDNWEFVGGAGGVTMPLLGLPVHLIKVPYYYGMLVTAIAAVYTSYRIKHSKFGLGLRAISQDEVKAEAAGIPTAYYKILAYAISAFFVGMAGSFWGQYLTYIRPNIFMIVLIAANLVLMSILGGKGTLLGPVIGAVLLISINEFFISQLGASELNIAGTGIIMLLVLLFFPEGIIGTLRRRGWLPKIIDWE